MTDTEAMYRGGLMSQYRHEAPEPAPAAPEPADAPETPAEPEHGAHEAPEASSWPGLEVSDPMLRAVAQSAVRQGWHYADHTLFPPGGAGTPVVLPQTLQWRAQKRALTALARQGLTTVRPSYQAPPAAGRAQRKLDPGKTDVGAVLKRLQPTVRSDAQGDGRWTLAQARAMVADGCQLDEVCQRTGWGSMWLQDVAHPAAG